VIVGENRTCFALKGQTPVIRKTGRRFGCNAIPALTNKGELNFMVFDGNLENAVFIRFLERLIKQARRKIFLVWRMPRRRQTVKRNESGSPRHVQVRQVGQMRRFDDPARRRAPDGRVT